MLFSTPLFLFIFMPLTTALYALAPRASRNAVLLAISILFYAWGEPRVVFLLFLSALLDYRLGLLVARGGVPARRWLAFGIAANLAILFIFKYLGFVVQSLDQVFTALPALSLALPLGISFYVFEKITYLVDIHRGETRPASSFQDYLLFVFLFPKMLAGPIIKYHEIAPAIGSRTVSVELATAGLRRFFWGLAKKVLIADVSGEVVNQVFALPPGSIGFADAWLGVTAFSVQVYFDFSGYSDMAVGLGRLFGFQLPENFDHPYGSASFTEYWRRWHISLSTWIRDYLYLPLGGSRRGVVRTYVNLWICFLLSGLWHGAAWNYLIWGAWNGLFMTLDRLFWVRLSERLPRVVAVGVFQVLLMFGWAMFRAPDLAHLTAMVREMVAPGAAGAFVRVDTDQAAAILLGFGGALAAATGTGRALIAAFDASETGRRLTTFAVMLLALLAMAKAVTVAFNPFLYFRF
jgi:alginate O-acetyltransferase complex protein AlgI